MIQHAFTSAYQNKVGALNQGINTITGGVKDVATVAVGGIGMTGGLGSGTIAKAAKFGLANKIGGVGGSIMMATMEEKVNSDASSNLIASASLEDLDAALDKTASKYKDSESIAQLDTVWNTISKIRNQNKQKEMLNDVVENLMGGKE